MKEVTEKMVCSYIESTIDNLLEERDKILRNLLQDRSEKTINSLAFLQFQIGEGEEILDRIRADAEEQTNGSAEVEKKEESTEPVETVKTETALEAEKLVRKKERSMTDEEINRVRSLIKAGYSNSEIQKKTGLSYYMVRKVVEGLK